MTKKGTQIKHGSYDYGHGPVEIDIVRDPKLPADEQIRTAYVPINE
jgi:hypothetical protein